MEEESENKQEVVSENTYNGLWLNRTKPHVAYVTMPESSCPSVGQIMNFVDTGSFFEGNVFQDQSSIIRWKNESDHQEMKRLILEEELFWFSLVRNPYTRILSVFSDKIFGYQKNGKRYRLGKVHQVLQKRGLKWGPGSNLMTNFRIFLKLVKSNIEQGKPFPPDIHWTPQYAILKASLRHCPDSKLDYVGHVETFRPDVDEILQLAKIDSKKLPPSIPSEKSTLISKIPLSDFFGTKEIEIMQQIYADDFKYLGYSNDPEQLEPFGKIDLETLNGSFHG